MDNLTVAHRFFYSGFNTSCNYSRMSVSYSNNLFYSYYTVIGAVIQDKQGNNVCLISSNNMSATTSKHINHLRRACPLPVYYVPFQYGEHYFSIDNVIKKLISNIDFYSGQKLTQKANREGFNENYNTLQTLLNDFKFNKENTKRIKEALKKYKKQYETINNSDSIKELKAKQRELDKKRIQKERAELNRLKKQYSYLELIQLAYNPYNNEYLQTLEYSEAKKLVMKIRNILNSKNNLAFIWFENDVCRTSKNITVDKKEVITLLKLWQHNKLKHGAKISLYTVLSVTNDFVQVGCHKIPVENLTALLNEVEADKTTVEAVA